MRGIRLRGIRYEVSGKGKGKRYQVEGKGKMYMVQGIRYKV